MSELNQNAALAAENNATAAAGAEAAAAAVKLEPHQFAVKFNFRSITPAAREELIGNLDTEAQKEAAKDASLWETVTEEGKPESTKVKRKSVSLVLDLPMVILNLPAAARSFIEDGVSRFVKAQYVEQFLPLGRYDLEYIAEEMAKSGRAARYDISDEQWAVGVDSFKRFVALTFAEHPAAKQIVERLGDIVKGKFSRNAITKNLGQFNEEMVSKFSSRLDSWANWLVETETEDGDALAELYGFGADKLKSYLKALDEAKVDFSSVL